MEIRNPIFNIMNSNQSQNNNNMNNNMLNSNTLYQVNPINPNLNPNTFNANNNSYNSNINNMNNNNSLLNNSTMNNNFMPMNNTIYSNPNPMMNNSMNNFNCSMNMNLFNNNMMGNTGFMYNNNNQTQLNNNNLMPNNMNNSMMMNSSFYNNRMLIPMNPMQFPYSYPIMNNMMNDTRYNFFNVNVNDNNNNNDGHYLNDPINAIPIPRLDRSWELNEYLFAPGNNADFNKLKKQFIKELDTYQYKNKDKFDNALIEDDCSICLCKYKITDMLTTLPCKHGFHKKCIKKWLSNDEHNKCPLCNLDIKAEVNKRKADLEKHIHDDEHEDD